MASFINLNDSGLLDEDQREAVQAAGEMVQATLAEAKGEAAGKAFETSFAALYGAEKPAELLDLMLAQEPALLAAFEAVSAEDAQAKKDARDKFEALFAVIFSLLVRVPEKDQKARVDKLVERIVVSEGESALRLRLLLTLFNSLGVTSPLRAVVFRVILKYASQVGSRESLLAYCGLLEEWMEDWKLSRAEKKDLWLTVAEMYKAVSQPEDSLAALHTCLKLYEVEGDVAEASEAAVRFIAEAIAAPKVLDVGDVLALRAVAALAQTPKGKQLVALLQLFRDGSLAGLTEFKKKNEAVFKEHGLSYEACEAKMKLLTLSSLAGAGTELPLSAVAAKLELSEEEAEQWVVRAVTAGFLGARVDQMRRVVMVKSAFQRTFAAPEWAKLNEQLGRWIRNLERLQGALAATKVAA
jgi:translation initiation factor 3 subunit M